MKQERLSEGEVDLHRKFEVAVQLVKSLPQSSSFSPSYAEATKIYSYFKQSKFGPCSIPRPGFWDVVNRAKWDAWSALGDMSAETAMKNYVEEIKKVYCRIKKMEVFREKAVDFADVLVPFCRATGADIPEKVLAAVNNELDLSDESFSDERVMINGSVQYEKEDIIPVNGDVLCNGDISADGNKSVISRPWCADEPAVLKVQKTVKFKDNSQTSDVMFNEGVSDKNENNGEERCSTLDVCDAAATKEEDREEGEYEKEDGELSTTDEDEEIYCDSLTPDQVAANVNQNTPVFAFPPAIEVVKASLVSGMEVVSREDIEEEDIEVIVEPQLFSPVSSIGFLDTTSQNVLCKSDHHSPSSSNNSKSEYELVNIAAMGKDSFEEVHNSDEAEAPLPCIKNASHVGSKQHSGSKERDFIEHVIEQDITACHCGFRSHHRRDSKPRQSHSGHAPGKRHNNGSGRNSKNESPSNSTSRHRHRQHSRSSKYIESTEDGSSNSYSDSGTSSSSSSSDNVGLKIVKALERMDDNMHLILKRLDSIDNSMKILAEAPPPPWWVQYIPSRSAILSTLWPFVVQLIVLYFWRRRRRRRRMIEDCKKSLVVTSNYPYLTSQYL